MRDDRVSSKNKQDNGQSGDKTRVLQAQSVTHKFVASLRALSCSGVATFEIAKAFFNNVVWVGFARMTLGRVVLTVLVSGAMER